MKLDIKIHGMHNDIKEIKYIKTANFPVMIWGAGELGKNIYDILKKNEVTNVFYTLSDKYNTPNVDGIKCISESCVDRQFEKYILVCGFFESYSMPYQQISDLFKNAVKIVRISELYGHVEKITEKIYKEYYELYNKVFLSLSDNKSKDSMKAYIEAKLNGDLEGLRNNLEEQQYFSGLNSYFPLTESEIFVNCGAFDGDTITDFIQNVGQYKKIYAIEADKKNINSLEKRIVGVPNIQIMPFAIGKENKICYFDEKGDMSSAISSDTDSGIKIEMKNLDSLFIDEYVTFINMDIEGGEMDALYGAEKIIRKYRPKLAISAYHKSDDIWKIYEYLNKLVPEYRFFFRVHKPLPVDAVLYAVI